VIETAGTGSPVFASFTDPWMIVFCPKIIIERKFNKKNNKHGLEVLTTTIVLVTKSSTN
jgi:hypothetical protein